MLISVLMKITVAVITIYIAFPRCNLIKFAVRSITYLGISMLICASVIIIELLWNPSGCAIYNDTVYFDVSPSLLIISTLIIYIALSIYNHLRQRHILNCTVKTVVINTEDKRNFVFESAIDTGCNLKEPFSGLPVIIVEKDLLDEYEISENLLRVIPFSTAAGTDIIMGFKPHKVFIDGKEVINGCYIGLCSGKLQGEIKSIMGTQLLEAI